MRKKEVVNNDNAFEKESISFVNQNTAILYVIMVIVSYIGAYFRFSQFSIYINDYFTLSDYVNFCFYSIILILIYLISVLSMYKPAFSFISKKVGNKKGDIPQYVFWFLLFIASVVKLISKDETVIHYANIFCMIPLQFILVFIFRSIGLLTLKTDKEILTGHLAAAIILLTIYIPYSASFAKLKNSYKQPTYTIYTNHNDTIRTNSNLIFIGTSEGYLFLYDKAEKMPIVFDRDEIYQINKKNIQPKKK